MSGSKTILPPAMILCGGQGTRIRDVTEALPKPLVPVGARPIVWHIMKTYAAFGVRRFILCLGFKRESFVDFFLNYRARNSDVTVSLGPQGHVTYHSSHDEDDWEVTLADTGENTMTGGRVWRASKYLRPEDEHCFLTYGDGLANIDIPGLYSHHLREKKSLTITAVHPTSRFGEMKVRGGKVTKFEEKPEESAGLINGGFMVFKRGFVQRFLTEDASIVFEKQPMQKAVAAGEMAAFTHTGFWQCMDTLREYQQLNQLWDRGEAPWTEAWKCSQMYSVVGGSSLPATPASKGRGSRRGLAA